MRQNRIMVTLSPAMTVALEILSERNGMPVATQARVVLRAALDRTIHSAEGQDRLRAHNAQRTADQQQEETQVDHELERSHAEQEEALAATLAHTSVHAATPAAPQPKRTRRQVHRLAAPVANQEGAE